MIDQEIDEAFSVKNDIYTINQVKSVYLLKKIKIKKRPFLYSFFGGMWYSTEKFSFDQSISLPYPFSTYYTYKILDKCTNNMIYRSALYIKTPLFIIQFKDTCIAIQFDPFIVYNNIEIFPFISLEENPTEYIISFHLFPSFEIKTKESAWLGRGKEETIKIPLKKGGEFRFCIKINKCKSWQEVVQESVIQKATALPAITNADQVFYNAKQALWRSYDALTGSFLQLPWKNSPGFALVHSSYSLLSYEAIRLDYFSNWNKTLHDKDFNTWTHTLKHHFINKNLSRKPKKQGEGLIWYNMTNLTKKGLQGYFYMDCGYAGYPGGQATICYHLLHYLMNNTDDVLKKRVLKTIQYIISTQHENGSWPMAIHHEGIIRFRPENLQKHISYGGTGEAIRSLFLASIIFNNKTYKTAAEHGLNFLSTAYPICYHGLRDIGINEPEAFSAVSIIHAFLDGFDHTSNKKYLKQAFNYAWYLVTWIYTFNTNQWKFSDTVHPISYSITPRVSPYETIWIVSLFLRLDQYSNDNIWEKLAKRCYSSILSFISHTGGLSEGIFPIHRKPLQTLPMEQTFATIELMNASYQFMNKKKTLTEQKTYKKEQKQINLKKDNNLIHIFHKNKRICSFDAARCQITYLKDVPLGKNGITLSINGPYSYYQRIKQKIKMNLRGTIGKYVLSIKDATYAVKGVKEPRQIKHKKIQPFSHHITSCTIDVLSKNNAIIQCSSQYHQVKISMVASIIKDKIVLSFDPIEISVLTHDLACSSIIFPYIDASTTKKDKHTIQMNNCVIKGDFPSVKIDNNTTLIDQTLQSNWTHGGKFSTALTFIIHH